MGYPAYRTRLTSLPKSSLYEGFFRLSGGEGNEGERGLLEKAWRKLLWMGMGWTKFNPSNKGVSEPQKSVNEAARDHRDPIRPRRGAKRGYRYKNELDCTLSPEVSVEPLGRLVGFERATPLGDFRRSRNTQDVKKSSSFCFFVPACWRLLR